MRLKRYLDETTDITKDEIEDIVDKNLNKFEKWYKKAWVKPWPIVWAKLNKIFEPYNISFGIKTERDMIASTGITKSDIYLVLGKYELKLLKSNIKKFSQRVSEFLIHELIHRKQFEKVPHDILKSDKKISAQHGSFKKYLIDNEEVEAFAKQAVSELENGEYHVIKTYYKEIRNDYPEAWKKFLKKVYYYLESSSEHAKNNLRDKLEKLKSDGT